MAWVASLSLSLRRFCRDVAHWTVAFVARIAESSYSRKWLPTDDEVCGILCAIQINLIRLYTNDDMGKTLSADIVPPRNNVNFAKALKCAVLALGVLTGAVAISNTVTNDIVVATSEAELRISDKGLGLGIEVVGGGAAEVKLETRPGWRFRDGRTVVTLAKAPGETVTSPEAKSEG